MGFFFNKHNFLFIKYLSLVPLYKFLWIMYGGSGHIMCLCIVKC